MNVGIDIDGTITSLPPLFATMTKALRAEGHKVFIVTFRHRKNRKETVEELKAMNIEYDKLIMGNYTLNLEWKAKQVIQHGFDAFFEDSEEVIESIKHDCCTFHVRGYF